ncbi:MAG: hypothetical protein AAF399_06695 [Bacteroidota bacterium]
MTRPRFLLVALLCGWLVCPMAASRAQCPPLEVILTGEWEVLDTLGLADCPPTDLLQWIGAAKVLLADTNFDRQTRGDICYSLIADELQQRAKEENFSLEEAGMRPLLAELEAQQYHLAVEQPSDWEKLAHYAQEGRFDYIARRFMDRGVPFYFLWLELILLGFEGWFWWRRKQRWQRVRTGTGL